MREQIKSVAVLLALAVPATSAPAPFARPDRSERRTTPLIAPGHYEMTWGGTVCNLWLYPDGCFRCDFAGGNFQGTWRFAGGWLDIAETTTPDDPRSWRFWSVLLCPKRTGRTLGDCHYPDTPVRLVPVP